MTPKPCGIRVWGRTIVRGKSVAMRGQTEVIRIITDQLLKQKEFKYRYEITSRESPDWGG